MTLPFQYDNEYQIRLQTPIIIAMSESKNKIECIVNHTIKIYIIY